MTDILHRTLTPSPDVAESPVGEETVILHLTNGTYYGLDSVGTRIWQMIKEGVAMPDICQRVAHDYDVDLATIESDARKFLADLEAQGILVSG
jgi:hypothetical protein